MSSQLYPLEQYLKERSNISHLFPNNSIHYFDKYKAFKNYMEVQVYPLIGAATSAEDGGLYTDHSITHFNAVITSLGKLLGVNPLDQSKDIKLNPYEVFVALIAVLAHDAGNIFGRKGHEKRTNQILKEAGSAIFNDNFEVRPIANIASAHGGKVKGTEDRDTISKLDELTGYGGINFRPRLIAALVRFADEICEDRSRAATYLVRNQGLPKWSEAYHQYANAITNVSIDLQSKQLSILYEISSLDVLEKFGKGSSESTENIFLVDEIILRLEKMFSELIYCKLFMYEVCVINKIRAHIRIHDEDDQFESISKTFEIEQKGYPSANFKFNAAYPDWSGAQVEQQIKSLKQINILDSGT